MKTGFSNTDTPSRFTLEEQENIQIILSLFLSNGMINAVKYSNYCNRNGATKEDMIYGLRYEVFEFLKRDDLDKGIQEIREELEAELDDESDDDEEFDNMMEDMVVADDEIDQFSRISNENITDENREFIENMHNYYDSWDGWQPETPLEQILKDGINKIN